MRIRKWDNKVEVTVKLIQKLRDSTILVHKKVLGTDVWDEFEDVANKYFLCHAYHFHLAGFCETDHIVKLAAIGKKLILL